MSTPEPPLDDAPDDADDGEEPTRARPRAGQRETTDEGVAGLVTNVEGDAPSG